MVTQPDFREWLECLNARGAEYVVVGAHALAFHGVVRYTGDLDVLVSHPSDLAHSDPALPSRASA